MREGEWSNYTAGVLHFKVGGEEGQGKISRFWFFLFDYLFKNISVC